MKDQQETAGRPDETVKQKKSDQDFAAPSKGAAATSKKKAQPVEEIKEDKKTSQQRLRKEVQLQLKEQFGDKFINYVAEMQRDNSAKQKQRFS